TRPIRATRRCCGRSSGACGRFRRKEGDEPRRHGGTEEKKERKREENRLPFSFPFLLFSSVPPCLRGSNLFLPGATMSLPYSPSARAAMDRARHQARGLAHELLGTEPVRAGPLHEPSGELAFGLSRLQVAAGRIRDELAGRLSPHVAEHLPRELPMTPRLARAMHFAEQEALAFEQAAFGAEHLLLGLLRQEQ